MNSQIVLDELERVYGREAIVLLNDALNPDTNKLFMLLDENRANITGFRKVGTLYSIHIYRNRDFKQEILTADEGDYNSRLMEAIKSHSTYESRTYLIEEPERPLRKLKR